MNKIKDLHHKIGITDRVVYDDGGFIGAGMVEGAENPNNVLGIRGVNKDGKEIFWLDMSLADAMAITACLNNTIRKYMNLTGLDHPNIKAHKKIKFTHPVS